MSRDVLMYIFVYPLFALLLALGLPFLFGGNFYISTLTGPVALLIFGIYKVKNNKA
ncbi:hypothetical protein K8O68_15335 [Salipaludibacillus sp. CUR1]|uniref:hypothetical protein n=1 Tax=Salipaludibacillus sp. CUR1 TaxID=2820003 RepID=UPI001E2C50AE|nr:hypothetical protein [Salipaludibacillus sp. CUR1]MCE7793796.1 hypothetical protein [Salipaludibacillus sp. CUR1]